MQLEAGERWAYLVHGKIQAFQHLVQVDFLDGHLTLLTEGEMAEEYGRIEGQGVHVLTGSSKDLAGTSQGSTLGFGFSGSDNVGNAHELEKSLSFGVVLSGNTDSTTTELFHVLCGSCLLGLFVCLFGFGLALEAFGEFARLELWWSTVEDVEWLDAVVNHAQGTVEHSHEMRGGFSRFVHQLLTFGADGNEE